MSDILLNSKNVLLNILNSEEYNHFFKNKSKEDKKIISSYIHYRVDLFNILIYKFLVKLVNDTHYIKFKSLNMQKDLYTETLKIHNNLNKNWYGKEKYLKNIKHLYDAEEETSWDLVKNPFVFAENIYLNLSSENNDYLKTKNISKYKINGLIVFIYFRSTKTREEIKILTPFNKQSKTNLYFVDLFKIINRLSPSLIGEITTLFQKYVKSLPFDSSAELSEIYRGFVCSLYVDDNSTGEQQKKNILSLIYNPKLQTNKKDIKTDLYFYFSQTGNFKKKYILTDIFQNEDLINFLEEKKISLISINQPLENNIQEPMLVLSKNVFVVLGSFFKVRIRTFFAEENNFKVENSNLIATVSGKKLNIDIQNILYTNFSHEDKIFNYDYFIYLDQLDEVYIFNIIQPKIDFKRNILFNMLNEKYTIRNFKIIEKREKNLFYYFSFINSDYIDWADIILFVKKNKKTKNITIDHFKDCFEIYRSFNEENFLNILNTFYYCSISEILKDINDNENKIKDLKEVALSFIKRNIVSCVEDLIVEKVIDFKDFIVKNYYDI